MALKDIFEARVPSYPVSQIPFLTSLHPSEKAANVYVPKSSNGTLVIEPAAPRSTLDAGRTDAEDVVVAKRGIWNDIMYKCGDGMRRIGCTLGYQGKGC